MMDRGLQEYDRNKLVLLMSQLIGLVEGLREGLPTSITLHKVEEISAAGGSIPLRSFEDIVPACLSVLSYFQDHALDLDKNATRLLSDCAVIIVKEIDAVLHSASYSTYEQERDRIFASLTVYVTDTTGFDLLHCEDTSTGNDDVANELGYPVSLDDAKQEVKGASNDGSVVDEAQSLLKPENSKVSQNIGN